MLNEQKICKYMIRDVKSMESAVKEEGRQTAKSESLSMATVPGQLRF